MINTKGDKVKSKSRIRQKYLVCFLLQLVGIGVFMFAFPDDVEVANKDGWILVMIATAYIFFMICEGCGKSIISELYLSSKENKTLNPLKGFKSAFVMFRSQLAKGVWSFPFRKKCPFCDMERY